MLFLAAQFVDLLWPTLLLLGIERVAIVPGITRVTPLDFEHYPVSHSLLLTLGWGLLFGLIYGLLRRDRRGALVCGAAVVSHWLLDLVVHRPDLPLYPGGPLLGFGLWNSLPATVAVEGVMFGAGVWLYARGTRARDRIGNIGLWGLVAFLLLIYAGNLTGPPPPDTTAIGWVGQAQWLLVIWGWWIDRRRAAV
jgi:membrane-bound metal-dependent hydrolase YbcI (DUF457 family)